MNKSVKSWIKWFTLAMTMKETRWEEMTTVVEEEGRSRRQR
jgi:hypothetical protein